MRRYAPYCVLLIEVSALTIGGCGDELVFRLPDPAVRYMAFGDSTTKGPSERDYVEFLAERLGEPAERFANEGMGGETSAEGVERLEALISRDLFPNAEVLLYWEGAAELVDFLQDHDPLLALSPDAPSYPFAAELIATLDATQANIQSAIRLGQDAGWRVLVATYFFLPEQSLTCPALLLDVLLPAQAEHANQYVARLNERIRFAAGLEGAVLVDVAADETLLGRDPALYFNCNHLSAQGNEFVADVFFEALSD